MLILKSCQFGDIYKQLTKQLVKKQTLRMKEFWNVYTSRRVFATPRLFPRA